MSPYKQKIQLNFSGNYSIADLLGHKDKVIKKIEDEYNVEIFVLGNVNEPGVFEIDREVNVLQAVSMAQGFTKWADKSEVKVLRKYGGVEKAITINCNKITSGKQLELNIPLQPGDTVYVP